MTSSPSSPPSPLVALVVGGGGSVSSGSVVAVGSAGGSVVGCVDDVGGGVTAPVFVGTGVAGVVVAGTLVGGLSVLRGVRITGVSGANVDVTSGVPVPAAGLSGHGCNVIGNCKQLAVSMQTFRVNDAFWAPRHSRIRRPLTSCAFKQVTPVFGSATLKKAWLDMIKTACASSFTQN